MASPFKVGDVLRYATGPTALFRVHRVIDSGTGLVEYRGAHCMGGPHTANEREVKLASAKDLQEWDRQKAWRLPIPEEYFNEPR